VLAGSPDYDAHRPHGYIGMSDRLAPWQQLVSAPNDQIGAQPYAQDRDTPEYGSSRRDSMQERVEVT
jgi:hypothetical protein